MAKPGSTGEFASAGPTAGRNWKDSLLLRQYRFPPSGEKEQDLAVRIEHLGVSFFFPLGTPDKEVGAARAQKIHELIVKQGWATASQSFSRELIIAFEWCLQPVLWTYTTIHTLLGDNATPETNETPPNPNRQRVLIVEQDPGIRRSLCWSINQQAGFCSIPCATVEAFAQTMARHKPHIVLLNRNLAGRLGFENPGTIVAHRSGLPALTYSVYADGDLMFVSTPGGAAGYVVKRVKPDRLLEPITSVVSGHTLTTESLLSGARTYFQQLLQSPSPQNKSALAKLTRRECEVLTFMSKGCADKEIAQAMGISIWTVHGHIKSIFERLNVHTRTEAVVRYLEK